MGVICGVDKINKYYHILISGIDNSGKTLFLYKWIKNYISKDNKVTTIPTKGFNFEYFELDTTKVTLWDFSGKRNLRDLNMIFINRISFDGIIYLINYDEIDKLEEAIEYLHDLMNLQQMEEYKLFIMINTKQISYTKDLNLNDKEDIKKELFIEEVKNRIYFSYLNQKDKIIDVFNIQEDNDSHEINLQLKKMMREFIKLLG